MQENMIRKCYKHRPTYDMMNRGVARDFIMLKVRKRANIRNRCNQAPHLTQDTNVKVTTLQLDITNERELIDI